MQKVISSLLFLSCISGFSQTRFDGLQQCLEYSKQNNPLLKIEKLNQEISQEKKTGVRSALLPQIKAFGNVDDNLSLPVQLVPAQFLGGNEGEYAQVKFGTQFSANYGAEASLSLINISNWKNLKAAALGEEISLHQAKDKELSITEQIIASYYFVLLSHETISLNRDIVTSSDSLLDAATIRLENGMIETLEYNRVKSINLESLQQLQESEAGFEKNLNVLKFLCGIPETDTLILSESIEQLMPSNTPSHLQAPVEIMPRYRMLQARTLQAQQEMDRQRSRTLPELSLYARYSRQAFRDEFNFFTSGPWFDVGVAGIRAEWNIFSGFNRQSAIRQATLQKQVAQYELDNYTTQAGTELEELKINHQVAAHGASRFMEHYQLNLMNHRIAGEKYNQGVYSIDQYVTIYQEMVRSQTQYLNKLANYLVLGSIVTTRNALK